MKETVVGCQNGSRKVLSYRHEVVAGGVSANVISSWSRTDVISGNVPWWISGKGGRPCGSSVFVFNTRNPALCRNRCIRPPRVWLSAEIIYSYIGLAANKTSAMLTHFWSLSAVNPTRSRKTNLTTTVSPRKAFALAVKSQSRCFRFYRGDQLFQRPSFKRHIKQSMSFGS